MQVMQNIKYLFFFLCFLCTTNSIIAQNKLKAPRTQKVHTEVKVTHAEKLGKIPPIRSLIKLPASDLEKRREAKKPTQVPPNFMGRGKSNVMYPELEHKGPDKIRQKSFNYKADAKAEVLVNIDGLGTSTPPNDPSGDAGMDYYVQATNITNIGIYDKEGTLVESFTGNTLWSSLGYSSAGDPIVLYDQTAKRWIITEFPPQDYVLMAISDSSDPLGGYTAYAFDTPTFPDYPKYGVWDNAYTLTTNEYESSDPLGTYVIDREAMLNGEDEITIMRTSLLKPNSDLGFLVAAAADWAGTTPPDSDPLFLLLNDGSWSGTDEDVIELYSADIDFQNETLDLTQTIIPVSPYDPNPCTQGFGYACATQPDGSGLDAGPEYIMHQPNYRNFGTHESLVFNFITDVTDGQNLIGIRWIELRKTGDEENWSVYQEGTFSPDDDLHRFWGGIAMDGQGNIGLAYNVSGDDEFAGIRFTGRNANDPLGVMTLEETTIVDGESNVTWNFPFSISRFADYSHMTIDPADDLTFWYTGEYASAGGGVKTRIFSFRMGRDSTDIGPLSVGSPISNIDLTDTEMVSINVTNFGVNTQEEFQVGYILEDNPPVIATVTESLETDATFLYTFEETIDMSAVGNYDLQFFTILEGDSILNNDTLHTVISHLGKNDAAITHITVGEAGCEEELIAKAVLTNLGVDPLTSVEMVISVNGIATETMNWTGTLAPNQSEEISVPINGFNSGDNTLNIRTNKPNGVADEIMENDAFNTNFVGIIGGTIISLELLTDEYPEETTWELKDEAGETLAESSSYTGAETAYTEEWCLAPNNCYTFTILDSYGDGICCGNSGEGNYSIVDANGNTLVSSNGQFNTEESNDFCVTVEGIECALSSSYSISLESENGANDGAILVVAQNGFGPFEYSIDGGATFQSENLFDGLAAGEYEVIVQDENDCTHTEMVEVTSCLFEAVVTVTNETVQGDGDGNIEISTANESGAVQYSIDGGSTFQSENTFANLVPNDYEIVIKDELEECTINQSVNLTFETAIGIETTTYGQTIEVSPNPTDGVFYVNITGLDQQSVFLPLEVFDAAGNSVYSSNLVRYDGIFTGTLSLYAYPSGVYYIRFANKDIKRMARVVRK